MRVLSVAAWLPAELAIQVATLAILLCGLAVMAGLSRLAVGLFMSAILVLSLPALDPLIDSQLDTLPTWLLFALGFLVALLALHALVALFFGRHTADLTIAGVLARLIVLLVTFLFTACRVLVRGMLRL